MHSPAASRLQAIFGKVKSKSDRLPKVSMVYRAGKAKRKLTRPKPKEARRELNSEMPLSRKMVVE